jgi:uncharacterized membrane protein YvlD (DUF360 family)
MIAPPQLPVMRTPTPWRPLRLIVVGIAQAGSLVAMAAVFESVRLSGLTAAVAVVVLLGLLGALVWPVAIRLTLPIIALTLGLFTFVLNGLAVLAVDALLDGFEVSSLWWGLLVSLVLTAVNISIGGLLNIDDDHVWRQRVVRRLVARRERPEPTSLPGVLFIQIDGLGAAVLRDAMASGHAPTLARLVEAGTHTLVPWECDLSSQTGAMQAGILLGDNSNMPAFRWYEKETGRVMVSNRPRDAAEIELRQSTGAGLLANGGASRANVFSGDAEDAMFTFSRVGKQGLNRPRFVYAIATPFAMLRIIVLAIVDIGRELRAARSAKRSKVEPRMHRGGSYPLLRAATTVALAEITHSMLIADIARGVPSAYVDLVGYDEVAHHSGIAAPEALDTLRRTDDQIRRVLTTLDGAPRPYFVVILSDHGQTQGWTFEQRYGHTLDQAIGSLAETARIEAPLLAEEGWNNINGLLSDVVADESRLGRTMARVVRERTVDGEVALGPATETAGSLDAGEIVVLASGNLGLVSFTGLPGRATRQQIDLAFPGLVNGLSEHEGIGFVMVRDEIDGDLLIGPRGVRHLADDRVVGHDPLEPFGPNAARHLRRTSSFTNCPDLLVNSFFDPDTDEGAAFEELIGFHGGLGGEQTKPFVLVPAGLTPPSEPLVGARSIHDLFRSWLGQVEAR